MDEFRQVSLPAKNGQQVDHKDPTPQLQPQAAPGEPPLEHGRPRHNQLTAGPRCKHPGILVPATWCYQANPEGPGTGRLRPARTQPGGGDPPRAGSLPHDAAKAVGDDLAARACFPGTPQGHPVAQVPKVSKCYKYWNLG